MRHVARTALMAPPLWASLAPPSTQLHTVVVIPVRSEAACIAATLAALAAQVAGDGQPLTADSFEIIVLANNCTDASAQIVRDFAAQHPRLSLHVAEVVFAEAEAHVGHARACLMDEACRRLLSVGRRDGIIASTDGDTRVAPDWLASIASEVHNGADAVGGRIEMSDDRPLPAGLARLARRDAAYQHLRNRLEHVLDPNPADPWPRHHQHFGASLAITVAAYLQVGGLPAKPFLEDEALCQALLAHDLKLRHSDKVKVVTSNRQRGRVAVGLSWQLREWSALASSDADAEVDDPRPLARDLVLRRTLRGCWAACRGASDAPPAACDATALAASLHVPADWLHAQLHTSQTFGQLWLAVVARRRSEAAPGPDTRMPMRLAIMLLRSMLAAAGDDRPEHGPATHADGAEEAPDDDPGAAAAVSAVRRGRAGSVLGAIPSPA